MAKLRRIRQAGHQDVECFESHSPSREITRLFMDSESLLPYLQLQVSGPCHESGESSPYQMSLDSLQTFWSLLSLWNVTTKHGGQTKLHNDELNHFCTSLNINR